MPPTSTLFLQQKVLPVCFFFYFLWIDESNINLSFVRFELFCLNCITEVGQLLLSVMTVFWWLTERRWGKKKDLFREGQVCFRDRSSADKRVMEKGGIGGKKEPLKMQKYKESSLSKKSSPRVGGKHCAGLVQISDLFEFIFLVCT